MAQDGGPAIRYPCPWPKCKRHQNPFPRCENLRNHIKKHHKGMHPDATPMSSTDTFEASSGQSAPAGPSARHSDAVSLTNTFPPGMEEPFPQGPEVLPCGPGCPAYQWRLMALRYQKLYLETRQHHLDRDIANAEWQLQFEGRGERDIPTGLDFE
jgi:hypothetical protein